MLFQWPLALLPVHIVFLELIIDPACSIIFENEAAEKNCMKKPPRDIKEPLFGKKAICTSLIQGLVILGAVVGIYRWAIISYGDITARTLAFMTLVISNLALIFINRSDTNSVLSTLKIPNPALWWISSSTIIMLSLVMTLPFFHKLFQFCYVHPKHIIYCITATILCIVMLEGLKKGFKKTF